MFHFLKMLKIDYTEYNINIKNLHNHNLMLIISPLVRNFSFHTKASSFPSLIVNL